MDELRARRAPDPVTAGFPVTGQSGAASAELGTGRPQDRKCFDSFSP
jgi:hypothetical protein